MLTAIGLLEKLINKTGGDGRPYFIAAKEND